MDIQAKALPIADWKADCMLIFGFEEEQIEIAAPQLWEAAPWLSIAPAGRDFNGKKGQQVLLYGFPDVAVPRVLLVGMGKRVKATMQDFRIAVAEAVKECQQRHFENLGVCAENIAYAMKDLNKPCSYGAREAVVAAMLCTYRCNSYKGKKEEETFDLGSFTVFCVDKEEKETLLTAARQGEAEAGGVLFARNLVNGPANIITPSYLAEEASKLAKRHDFSCTVYGEEEAKKMGMGAFYAVARGAEEESKFIILEYAPKGKEQDDPFIVIGKGITFDTGGISLKPAAKMHEMKGDMAGSAAVFGFFEAIGALPDKANLPRIIGIVPATENMPGSQATRPGDIVTTLSGQTVEILNTDAEGRLVLCDALTYAQNNWKPKALVDIATLTGACVVALGDDAAGLFTMTKWLRSTVLDVAEDLGELYWPLPMWDQYDKNIDSDVADIANVGPREGGALHAALFLRRFVQEGVSWAHFDIAGSGYVVKPSPLSPVSGGTGEGVRMFCEMARRMK